MEKFIQKFNQAKENSKEHTKEEISFFIKNLDNFSQGDIASWLKAVKKNGLTFNETSILTYQMASSGKILSWEDLEPTVDKHSTGGVGDKVTLLFVPLLAAYGINVPKLSGRSLGITGGTIDKLESIPGFKSSLTIDQIKEQIKKIGLAICSTTTDIAPADKKLYAIRDVTDTIDSIPLIASSIMSKKIAGGASNIVLDVKCGSGAFMKKLEDAEKLSEYMSAIGKNLHKKVKAVITNMDQPLGYAAGNSLEVKEVLDVMSGKDVPDLIELVIFLGIEAVCLVYGKKENNLEEKLLKLLCRGAALKKFEEMVQAQGGNLTGTFKKADHIEIIKSHNKGYIEQLDAKVIGEIVHLLGAGRNNIEDKIDYSVGIVLCKKTGDPVKQDETLAEVHMRDNSNVNLVKEMFNKGIKIGQKKPTPLKLIRQEK